MLDVFHFHEVLDRIAVTQSNIEENISSHIVVERFPHLKDLLDEVQCKMYDVYQEVDKIYENMKGNA